MRLINVIIFVILLYFLLNAILTNTILTKYWDFFNEVSKSGSDEIKISVKEFRKTMITLSLLAGIPILILSRKSHRSK